jgi:DNA-binding transcriptional ArsR family regulator
MARSVGVTIGETEIARRLYAGRYADILGETIDSQAAGSEPADVAFVVGALSFVGRVEEAELFLENHRRGRQPSIRTLAAGGFFVTVAHARSGDFVRARRTLVRAYRETSARRDAWSRAFLFQAIACCHYFTAKYTRAARAALNAQASALEARFAYVQMLATDMRAHVLAQRGDLDEGLRLLEQARNHAHHLGFDVNVRVIEVSVALERARVNHPVDAIAMLEHLLEATDIQDSYSRRLLLCELGRCYALVGRGQEAHRAVDEAARLGTRDPRAQAALACARAEVARIVGGWATAPVHLADARRLASGVNDPPLQAEIAGLELGCATFLGDSARRASAIRELESLVAEHNLYRARSWLFQYDVASTAADSDELARTLRPVVATARDGLESREASQAVLRTGLWGLVAEAGGLRPARRIHLFEDAEVLEAEGDVRRLHGLPPRGRAVLVALGRRPLSKEALLASVWGVSTYRPERHDSLVKTTISRLRAALGRDHMWVETVEGGYGIAPTVEVVAHGYELATEPSSLAELTTLAGGKTDDTPEDARAVRWARLAQELGQSSERSAGDLAVAVRASLRTVSRDLSEMNKQGLVERIGEGRGTRYRARKSGGGPGHSSGHGLRRTEPDPRDVT